MSLIPLAAADLLSGMLMRGRFVRLSGVGRVAGKLKPVGRNHDRSGYKSHCLDGMSVSVHAPASRVVLPHADLCQTL